MPHDGPRSVHEPRMRVVLDGSDAELRLFTSYGGRADPPKAVAKPADRVEQGPSEGHVGTDRVPDGCGGLWQATVRTPDDPIELVGEPARAARGPGRLDRSPHALHVWVVVPSAAFGFGLGRRVVVGEHHPPVAQPPAVPGPEACRVVVLNDAQLAADLSADAVQVEAATTRSTGAKSRRARSRSKPQQLHPREYANDNHAGCGLARQLLATSPAAWTSTLTRLSVVQHTYTVIPPDMTPTSGRGRAPTRVTELGRNRSRKIVLSTRHQSGIVRSRPSP
jgi:hypothetical protein